MTSDKECCIDGRCSVNEVNLDRRVVKIGKRASDWGNCVHSLFSSLFGAFQMVEVGQATRDFLLFLRNLCSSVDASTFHTRTSWLVVGGMDFGLIPFVPLL